MAKKKNKKAESEDRPLIVALKLLSVGLVLLFLLALLVLIMFIYEIPKNAGVDRASAERELSGLEGVAQEFSVLKYELEAKSDTEWDLFKQCGNYGNAIGEKRISCQIGLSTTPAPEDLQLIFDIATKHMTGSSAQPLEKEQAYPSHIINKCVSYLDNPCEYTYDLDGESATIATDYDHLQKEYY